VTSLGHSEKNPEFLLLFSAKVKGKRQKKKKKVHLISKVSQSVSIDLAVPRKSLPYVY